MGGRFETSPDLNHRCRADRSWLATTRGKLSAHLHPVPHNGLLHRGQPPTVRGYPMARWSGVQVKISCRRPSSPGGAERGSGSGDLGAWSPGPAPRPADQGASDPGAVRRGGTSRPCPKNLAGHFAGDLAGPGDRHSRFERRQVSCRCRGVGASRERERKRASGVTGCEPGRPRAAVLSALSSPSWQPFTTLLPARVLWQAHRLDQHVRPCRHPHPSFSAGAHARGRAGRGSRP